jgi:CubicO group peptidase (beta-lactamase class C family)
VTIMAGTVVPGFEALQDYLRAESERDHEYCFQLAVYRDAELVVDLWGGDAFTADSLMIPMSVSKNSIAFAVGLLVDRGELDLDAPVAHYWPEFAAEGKGDVRVRELLSHQAGLPETRPRLSDEELGDPVAAAARLAAQLPWWRPGAVFGYHALTIGLLGAELVRRVSGRPFGEFFDAEFRAPRDLDFHIGSTPELETRVVETLPMVRPDGTPAAPPFTLTPGQIGREVFASVAVQRAPDEQLAWAQRQRRLGNPAGFATVSARGIAALFAETVVGVTGPALISAATIERLAQLQVAGTDHAIGIPRTYGIVFQKPTPNLAFGSHRAFGHDGAGGALGFHDPHTGVSFGYTVRRTPFPGGADARAIELARLAHEAVEAAR